MSLSEETSRVREGGQDTGGRTGHRRAVGQRHGGVLYIVPWDPGQGAVGAVGTVASGIRQNLCLDRPALTPRPRPMPVKLVSRPHSPNPTPKGSVTPPLCAPGSTPAAGPGPSQLLFLGPGALGPPTSLRSAGRKRPSSPTVTLRFLPLLGPEGTFPRSHQSFPGSTQTQALPSRCPFCPWNQLWGLGSR